MTDKESATAVQDVVHEVRAEMQALRAANLQERQRREAEAEAAATMRGQLVDLRREVANEQESQRLRTSQLQEQMHEKMRHMRADFDASTAEVQEQAAAARTALVGLRGVVTTHLHGGQMPQDNSRLEEIVGALRRDLDLMQASKSVQQQQMAKLEVAQEDMRRDLKNFPFRDLRTDIDALQEWQQKQLNARAQEQLQKAAYDTVLGEVKRELASLKRNIVTQSEQSESSVKDIRGDLKFLQASHEQQVTSASGSGGVSAEDFGRLIVSQELRLRQEFEADCQAVKSTLERQVAEKVEELQASLISVSAEVQRPDHPEAGAGGPSRDVSASTELLAELSSELAHLKKELQRSAASSSRLEGELEAVKAECKLARSIAEEHRLAVERDAAERRTLSARFSSVEVDFRKAVEAGGAVPLLSPSQGSAPPAVSQLNPALPLNLATLNMANNVNHPHSTPTMATMPPLPSPLPSPSPSPVPLSSRLDSLEAELKSFVRRVVNPTVAETAAAKHSSGAQRMLHNTCESQDILAQALQAVQQLREPSAERARAMALSSSPEYSSESILAPQMRGSSHTSIGSMVRSPAAVCRSPYRYTPVPSALGVRASSADSAARLGTHSGPFPPVAIGSIGLSGSQSLMPTRSPRDHLREAATHRGVLTPSGGLQASSNAALVQAAAQAQQQRPPSREPSVGVPSVAAGHFASRQVGQVVQPPGAGGNPSHLGQGRMPPPTSVGGGLSASPPPSVGVPPSASAASFSTSPAGLQGPLLASGATPPVWLRQGAHPGMLATRAVSSSALR